jgi:hypothetical protein
LEGDHFAVVRFETHRVLAGPGGSGPHVVLIGRATRLRHGPQAGTEASRTLDRAQLVHLAEATFALRRIRLESLTKHEETH